MLEITLKNPEYYLERIQKGCILDPSVFYSKEYVDATVSLMSEIKPSEIYLPSNLLNAYKQGAWTSFLTTLTLWSGNYEKIPDAWRESDLLVDELSPKQLQLSDEDEKARPIFEAIAEGGELSPLNRILFELTAYSYIHSIPIYVGSHSKFRYLELLNSKLQTVLVEPLGQWAKRKKEYLTEKKGRIALFALYVMGGAFVFIESVTTGSALGMGASGSVITATIIDGSL